MTDFMRDPTLPEPDSAVGRTISPNDPRDLRIDRDPVKVSPEEQPSPTEIAFHTLRDEIDQIYQAFDYHVNKIDGVMSKEGTEPAQPPPETPNVGSSDLVIATLQQATRVRQLRHYLQLVTRRVEI